MQIINVEQNTDEWLEKRKGKVLGSNVYNVLSAKTGTKAQVVEALEKYGIEYPMNSKGIANEVKSVYEKLLTPEAEAYLMARSEKKVEFYQLIADRIAIDTTFTYDDSGEIIQNHESMMDRGHRLEDDAAAIFAERTGKQLAQVGICVRDDNPNIGNSPDRLIVGDDERFTEALEIKCIKTAKHLQSYIEKTIPDEYFSQAVQYFVVNDDLQKLYFAFYDPRIPFDCQFHWVEINRTDDEVAKRIPQYLAYEKILLAEVDEWVERLSF